MNKFLRLILAISLVLTTGTSSGQEARTAARPPVLNITPEVRALADKLQIKLSPLPGLIESHHDNISSISEIIGAMGVTQEVFDNNGNEFQLNNGGQYINNGNAFTVYQGIDAVKYETKIIEDFIFAHGAFSYLKGPVSGRGVIISRYGVEDHPGEPAIIADLMGKIKDAKAHSAILITDGPISTDKKKAGLGETGAKNDDGADDSSGEKNVYSNRISPDVLNDDNQGKTIREILKKGYDFKSPVYHSIAGDAVPAQTFFVTMSAMQAGERVDIMHQKEIILYELKDPSLPLKYDNLQSVVIVDGSANWTRAHFNENKIVFDDMQGDNGIGRFALSHAFKLLENFAGKDRTGIIGDIESPGRFRMYAKDGSYVETAYTDGQWELNERIALELLDIAAHPENYQIDKITLGEFVFTNGNVLTALRAAWDAMNAAGRPFVIEGILDSQFVSAHNFGLGAVMAGYDVITPFGRIIKGWTGDILKKVQITVDFETHKDASNIDPEGAPHFRILMHGKFLVIKGKQILNQATKDFVNFASVYFGSFNLSNNKKNAERQDHFMFYNKTPGFAIAVVTSIVRYVDKLLGRKAGANLEKAVLVDGFAKLAGQSADDLLEVPDVDLLPGLIGKVPVSKENLDRFGQILRTLRTFKPSRLDHNHQVSQEKLEAQINSIQKFFNWYSRLDSFKQGIQPDISKKELIGLIFGIVGNPNSAKAGLKSILWRPGIPEQILEARAYEAYHEMELDVLLKTAKEDGQFPFAKDIVLTANLLSATEIGQLAKLMLGKQVSSAATLLGQLLNSRITDPAKKQLISDNKGIERNLTNFLAFADWYTQVPLVNGHAVANISKSDLVNRVFFDNLDLIGLQNTPANKIDETTEYLLRLRGYDNDTVLNPLLVKAREILQIQNIPTPAKPIPLSDRECLGVF